MTVLSGNIYKPVARTSQFPNSIPQGCQYSPDGLCVLTSVGNELHLYNTVEPTPTKTAAPCREWKVSLISRGGDTVRSYAWFPKMNSSDPTTCCFVGTSRDQPVHLYDAYTSRIRATYTPFNEREEMESPSVLTFNPDGHKLICSGFRSDRSMHVFDISVPGKQSTNLKLGKTRRSRDGQKGIVSALTCSDVGVMAVGTYSPGSIYLYDDRILNAEVGTVLNGVCVVGHGKGHAKKKRRLADISSPTVSTAGSEDDIFASAKVKWFQSRVQGGITMLRFSPRDNHFLFSANRRSDAILVWDVRKMTTLDRVSMPICGVSSFEVKHRTNQRLQFDFHQDGQHLLVGGTDNKVRIYNTKSNKLMDSIDYLNGVPNGVPNGVSCSPVDGQSVAIAIGSRRFPSFHEADEDISDALSETGCLELGSLRLEDALSDAIKN